jgi:hypothetical protein
MRLVDKAWHVGWCVPVCVCFAIAGDADISVHRCARKEERRINPCLHRSQSRLRHIYVTMPHALNWANIAELAANCLQAGVEAKTAKAQAKVNKAAVKAASKGKAPAKKRKSGKKMPEPDRLRILRLVLLMILLTPCKQITDEEDEDDNDGFQDEDEDGPGGETDAEGDHDCGGRLV